MHDGDLAGRPAEADEAEFEPEGEGFPQRDGGRRMDGFGGGVHRAMVWRNMVAG
jgi:hypothetical protein